MTFGKYSRRIKKGTTKFGAVLCDEFLLSYYNAKNNEFVSQKIKTSEVMSADAPDELFQQNRPVVFGDYLTLGDDDARIYRYLKQHAPYNSFYSSCLKALEGDHSHISVDELNEETDGENKEEEKEENENNEKKEENK